MQKTDTLKTCMKYFQRCYVLQRERSLLLLLLLLLHEQVKEGLSHKTTSGQSPEGSEMGSPVSICDKDQGRGNSVCKITETERAPQQGGCCCQKGLNQGKRRGESPREPRGDHIGLAF